MHSFICRHRVSLNVQRVTIQTFDRQNNFCKDLLFAIWITSSPLNVSSSWTKRASSLSVKLKEMTFVSQIQYWKNFWNDFDCLNYCGLKSNPSQWAGYIRSFSWEAFRTGEDSGQRARLSGLREVPPNRRTTMLSKLGHHLSSSLLFSKLRQLEIRVARRSGSSIKNIRVRLCLCYLPPPCCVCPGRARVFQRFSASCWTELLWVLHLCVTTSLIAKSKFAVSF